MFYPPWLLYNGSPYMPMPQTQPQPPSAAPPQPTRYTLEEITPLIKTIMEQMFEAQSVAFNINEEDDDDDEADEDYEIVVDLEDLRNHTKISVVQVLVPEHNMCAVCHEEYQVGEVVRELRCKHKFHQACVDRVLENAISCPMCRINVVPNDVDD